ncbi:MAG TPA: zinc-dependent metalloprotease [Actinomycetota bacterium]|nr:zinc-dependent metalloprotease [Actinomycetota bacterium]
MAQIPPFGDPDDRFADVPLLREIQRVLLSGSGPVNWELARQIGIAAATWGREDPHVTEDDQRGLEGAARMAELAVADHTGLTPPADVTRVRAVRRAQWVEANVAGMRELFEPGAERLARAFSEAQAREGAALPEGTIGQVMSQMAPLLVGAQIGAVIGSMGQRVLGQYEIPLPRRGEPALLFVIPNIAELEREWSLPSDEFRAWAALHETAHAFQMGQPWVRDHFLSLIREVASGLDFDLSALEDRLEGVDLSDPQRLAEALGGPGELLEASLNDEQRLLLRRIQAFISAAEGHADHVMNAVGRRVLTSYERIDEAMRRRHEGRSEEERAVERMLGIDLKLEQYRLGRAFCQRVVELTDERTLSRMWHDAESLPSMPELEEPTLWLSRIA